MKLVQISIFLENKAGRLAELCSLLGDNNINIRALTVAESDDFGVLRIVVDKPDQALPLIKEKGFVANKTDIVALEVEDKPGGLANVLKILSGENINIEYMYGFVEKNNNNALIVFRFEDIDKAIEVLKNNNIKIISNQEIAGL